MTITYEQLLKRVRTLPVAKQDRTCEHPDRYDEVNEKIWILDPQAGAVCSNASRQIQ